MERKGGKKVRKVKTEEIEWKERRRIEKKRKICIKMEREQDRKEGQEQDIYNQKENENRWMIRQERG